MIFWESKGNDHRLYLEPKAMLLRMEDTASGYIIYCLNRTEVVNGRSFPSAQLAAVQFLKSLLGELATTIPEAEATCDRTVVRGG